MTAIEWLLSIAEGEVGSSNSIKYGRNLFQANTDTPWSDLFVDWCLTQAFGSETAGALLCDYIEPFTAHSLEYYQAKGRYEDKPRRGDLIVLTDASGQNWRTGIVCDFDETAVYTIEGDTRPEPGVEQEGVYRKQRLLAGSSIAGYVRPDWNKLPAEGASMGSYHWQGFLDLTGKCHTCPLQTYINQWKVEVITL